MWTIWKKEERKTYFKFWDKVIQDDKNKWKKVTKIKICKIIVSYLVKVNEINNKIFNN